MNAICGVDGKLSLFQLFCYSAAGNWNLGIGVVKNCSHSSEVNLCASWAAFTGPNRWKCDGARSRLKDDAHLF